MLKGLSTLSLYLAILQSKVTVCEDDFETYSKGVFVSLEPSPFSGHQLSPFLGEMLFLLSTERFREEVVLWFPLPNVAVVSFSYSLQLCTYSAGIRSVDREFSLSSALILASVSRVYSFGITPTQTKMNIHTVTLGKLKKAHTLRGRSSLGFMNELFVFRVHTALEEKKILSTKRDFASGQKISKLA